MQDTIASSEKCKLLFIYVAFYKELWEKGFVQGSTTIALVKTLRPIHVYKKTKRTFTVSHFNKWKLSTSLIGYG